MPYADEWLLPVPVERGAAVSDESERYHDKKAGILFYHVAGHEEDVRISRFPRIESAPPSRMSPRLKVNIPACALLGWAANAGPGRRLSVLRDLVALADDEDGKKHAAELVRQVERHHGPTPGPWSRSTPPTRNEND